MAVAFLDEGGGQALRLQQRGDLVGVDGGADTVGEFGGQCADRLLVGAAPRQPDGERGVVEGPARAAARRAGLGQPQGQGVLFGAAGFEGYRPAHPATVLTGASASDMVGAGFDRRSSVGSSR